MNGGIFHSSTFTGMSLRGAETLNTLSPGLPVPLSPVTCTMRLVSSDAACAAAIATRRESAQAARCGNSLGFMFRMLLGSDNCDNLHLA
jgi:hypothetical protein